MDKALQAKHLNLRVTSPLSVLVTYGLLAALVGVVWRPGSLVVAGTLSLALLALNARLYRFFWRKRGFGFAIRIIPWHWLYYLYNGLAFFIGTARRLAPRRRVPKADLPKARGEWSDK